MTLHIDRAAAKADIRYVLDRHGPVSGREAARLSGYSCHVVRPILRELAASGEYVELDYRPPRPAMPPDLAHLTPTQLARAMGVSVRTAARRLASTPPASTKAPPTPTP
jgi:hypothetical protein